jgi:hypothetical protein
MKGKDRHIFYMLLLISFFVGIFVFDKNFILYAEMITFLSIMIGFKITSLSILFNSPLKKTLYDRRIKIYETELHRLKDFYKHSLFFEVFCVFVLFLPVDSDFKYLIIMPILIGVIFCFYKISDDLFRIFVYPTTK